MQGQSTEPFVGRVYGDGLVWRFSTTDRETRGSKSAVHVPTIEQVGLPLRMALGQPLGVPTSGGHADARGNTMVRIDEKIFVRGGLANTSATRRLPVSFPDGETAEAYLAETVASARENLTSMLGVEGLVLVHRAQAAQVVDQATDPWRDHAFSADVSVAVMQRRLAAALTQGQDELAVRNLAATMVDEVIGTPYPRQDVLGGASRWFDPDLAARWAVGEESPMTTLRKLNAAVRATGRTPEAVRAMLLGEDRRVTAFCDDLLDFDAATAQPAAAFEPGSVRRAALEAVESTLAGQGLYDIDAEMDAQGVVHWNARRLDGQGNPQPGYATGRLGQVFEPDEHGALRTRFAGGDNHLVVPGYRATILPQHPQGPEQDVEARTRLRGYREEVLDRIRQQVANDVVGPTEAMLGSATSLNGVYRTLFDVRYPLDHLERAGYEGTGDLARRVLATQAGRVRYPEWISDTMHQAWLLDQGKGVRIVEATGWTEMEAVGFRNRTILSPESDGFFDPMMTTDSAPGVTRFLVEGARVDAEGRIIPGELDARAPVALLPGLESCSFDAFDRQRMTLMGLLTASRVTDPVMVAQVPLAGWTMEDGMVVSAEFAASQRMLDPDGGLRALQVGDKISDLHGSKGVVALVVDRWRAVDGSDPLLDEVTGLFADNPRLDVVMSPFGALSRFNGGIPREAMAATQPLVGAAGLPLPSAAEMGSLRMVVTNKSVTAGTRVYADPKEAGRFDDVEADLDELVRPAVARTGGPTGRRVSGQLAWALQSQGCPAVMDELYRHNGAATDDLSEYLGLVGLGVDELGELQPSRQGLEVRRVIDIEPVLDARGALQRRRTRELFAEQIANQGGDLLLPFDLELPTGDTARNARRGLEPGPVAGTWRLPVLSAHLRKPVPGATAKGHEYSGIYERIFLAASNFKVATAAGGESDLERASAYREIAQRELSSLTSRVVSREFEGRHNIFRDSLMAARQPRSATAVWTADPRLGLDELGVSAEMAARLGVSDGSRLLAWRDPVLRSAGVRYLRVKVDAGIHGVSINPLATKNFDGDFDGDSVGVVALPQPAAGETVDGFEFRAHREALSRLTVEANLVDLGVLERDEAAGFELHPLAMHTGSDVATGNPVDLTGFTVRANDITADLLESRTARSRAEALQQGRELVAELSQAMRGALLGMSRRHGLQYSRLAGHLASIKQTCLDTGAKGSPAALADYSRYLGIDAAGTDVGQPCPDGGVRLAHQGVNVALVVKKAVGIPGRISQRAVVGLRGSDLSTALELTYPCTQSQMQAKHDPAGALQKYTVMQTAARDLWRGYRMDPAKGFGVVTDEQGQPVRASHEEWVDQALALYRAKDGLNIPRIDPHLVRQAADALTGPDGYVVNIEELGGLVDTEGMLRPPSGARATSNALDRLAYQPGFSAVLAECRAGSRLFEGPQEAFAPATVKRNLRQVAFEQEQEALFEGVAEVAGPHDRKVGVDAMPVGASPSRREGGQVVGHGRADMPLVPVGRRDVLAPDQPGFGPRGGSTGAVRQRIAVPQHGLPAVGVPLHGLPAVAASLELGSRADEGPEL